MNLKMSNKKSVIGGLGDGASEEGVFWETLIAAYKVPIIFCEI